MSGLNHSGGSEREFWTVVLVFVLAIWLVGRGIAWLWSSLTGRVGRTAW